MPKAFEKSATGNAKLSLTVTDEASRELRRLADEAGITLAELVRRSVGTYRVFAELSPDEEVCVRNTRSGELTRLRLIV